MKAIHTSYIDHVMAIHKEKAVLEITIDDGKYISTIKAPSSILVVTKGEDSIHDSLCELDSMICDAMEEEMIDQGLV